MAGRTWVLQLNLDELNALTASLWTDQDRAAALQGISLGCNAGPCPEGVPDSFRRAWEISRNWREKADGYKEAMSAAGTASAASRKAKSGSAQPCRTRFEHALEPGSKGVQTTLELNQNPETSILEPNTEGSSKSICPEPSAPAPRKEPIPLVPVEPPIFTLPCIGKGPKEWPVTAGMLADWQDAYPGLSPLPEAKKMRLWLEANPKNQKTFSGMGRFANSWLSRAQNGAARTTSAAPPRHTTAENAAWLAQMET